MFARALSYVLKDPSMPVTNRPHRPASLPPPYIRLTRKAQLLPVFRVSA